MVMFFLLLKGRHMGLFGLVQIVVVPLEILTANTNPRHWRLMVPETILLVPLRIHMTGLGAIPFAASKINLEEGFSSKYGSNRFDFGYI